MTQAASLNPFRTFPTPQRLSDPTRALAARALCGEHGRSMVPGDTLGLDPSTVEGLGESLRYGRVALFVAEHAPLRILPGERIVGAATLREAAFHATPVLGGSSTSHTTVGFHRALRVGYRGLRRQVQERLARGDLDDGGREFLQGMLLCLEAATLWHRRHLDLLDGLIAGSDGEEAEGYREVRRALERVPEEPPRTFHEAVQALWFLFAFQRLMGNWSGIGRIDQMLGPFLQADLASGRIDLGEARELLAHFWIKGCEWIGVSEQRGSGDAQHYQNVVLSGVDAAGQDVTNEVTYLVLDVVEELLISDYPIAVRLNRNTPEPLLRRIAEVQRHGGGIVSVYNEEVVLAALDGFGYAPQEARCFANDGCWEVIIPGKTAFGYSPFDMLALLHEVLGLHNEGAPPDFPDFESLYAAFLARLSAHIAAFNDGADGFMLGGTGTPLLSLLVEDCIERARDYRDRGAVYNVLSPHAGGMANVANSLVALDELVYGRRLMALPQLVETLRADWDGAEDLRRLILNQSPAYGNDDEAADRMMQRLYDDYTSLVWQTPERDGVLRPCGISTFGREIAWAYPRGDRLASPDGHRKGEILATNFSPSPGTDRRGPTAVVKSYCKMDLTRVPSGATIELKLLPESLQGEAGVDALVGLLRGLVDLGGFYMQIDAVDRQTLLEAQKHPERYQNLAVRISGWSARFVTLDEHWQQMIIDRTQQRL